MGQVAYLLCALTSLLCFALLLRAYLQNHSRLLLWSGVCFGFYTLQNTLLVLDLIVFPTQISLVFWRTLSGFVGSLVLLFGLIWENR